MMYTELVMAQLQPQIKIPTITLAPSETARPFLKWAGGKGQLLDSFSTIFPKQFKDGQIDTYIEPFVGGGAVLFYVLQNFDIKRAVIIDYNKELINCYACIKEAPLQVIYFLKELDNEFKNLDTIQREAMFLRIREQYNAVSLNGRFDYQKAALLIFLNKTCFNGLYRVNSKGGYNVPFGGYRNPLICDASNLLAVSALLQKVTILHGDYSQLVDHLGEKTFIYFDPPYRPITTTQSFTSYSQNGFNDQNQNELATLYRRLSEMGCLCMLSNSDPKNSDPNDNFFDELFKGFNIARIHAKRMINCQADKRGAVTEIVVTNYCGGEK